MIIDIVLMHATGRGGLETVLLLISEELAKRGYRVRVVQFFESDHKKWEEGMNEFYSFYSCDETISIGEVIDGYDKFINEKGRPNIILATAMPMVSYICTSVLLKNNLTNMVPVLSWVHVPLEYLLNNELLEFADAHLAISEGVAKGIELFSKDKPIYLINNPIKVENKVIPRAEDKLKMIYVGRLTSIKNVEVILEEIKSLQGNFELNIYGDGENRENLLKLSKECGLEEKVIWHGWKRNVWDNIDSASVLVHASISEGFGMVMIEALSRGIPVISSKTDGGLVIVKESINGWLFDIRDSNKLSEILNDIQSKKLQLPAIEDCINSISKFSIKNVVDDFESSILLEYNKINNGKILEAFQNINDSKLIEENLEFLNSLNESIIKYFVVRNNSSNFVPILNKVAILN
ncbi:UDP-D-galactose:(glucosyl)LPS alpha-1,6-D-galactosyltransferase [Clostridium sp. DSM 8431]|uniref:glycosyltransferase n=1 Tax=Clostridium sp. DSM 8431 TaxID=1761781 RepID=UPI0008EA2848|nr:glycosyltransferase [Clostridium sp. DSM 8431]SFU84199.1 UDP-D-galactose:(glucosyl)LPS alpha-1,6-D-galactosyltransferase [Clostridium sp. DSM 8431]